jgi:hypothetical protein
VLAQAKRKSDGNKAASSRFVTVPMWLENPTNFSRYARSFAAALALFRLILRCPKREDNEPKAPIELKLLLFIF